jgi:hypothetical protein
MDEIRASMSGLKSRGGWLLLLAVATVAAGCGRRDMGAVTGRVTFGGQPVPEAVVSFFPKNRPMSAGKTDADGRFVLQTFRKGDGAFLGACKVTIFPFLEGEEPPPGSTAPPDKPLEERGDIPEVYWSPATSPLTADVVAGKSNQFNFELAP